MTPPATLLPVRPPIARCRCRPGCLTVVTPSDDVIRTRDGDVLLAHLTDQTQPIPAEVTA